MFNSDSCRKASLDHLAIDFFDLINSKLAKNTIKYRKLKDISVVDFKKGRSEL